MKEMRVKITNSASARPLEVGDTVILREQGPEIVLNVRKIIESQVMGLVRYEVVEGILEISLLV